jgi:hypothetical protein
MGKFLKKLVMVVRVVKIVLRIVNSVMDVLDDFATKLSDKEAY